MPLEVRRRKAEAARRRKERLAEAETPTDQLNASFDYLRASLRAASPETGDRVRLEVAQQLVQVADRIRTK